MEIRFVSRRMHAYLDYPVAVSLLVSPFILGLGRSHPAALWLSVEAGVAALALSLLTNHETGLIRIIPYAAHVWVDRFVGVVFLVAPVALGFAGLDAWYYYANAVAVLLVTTVLAAPDAARAGTAGPTLGLVAPAPRQERS